MCVCVVRQPPPLCLQNPHTVTVPCLHPPKNPPHHSHAVKAHTSEGMGTKGTCKGGSMPPLFKRQKLSQMRSLHAQGQGEGPGVMPQPMREKANGMHNMYKGSLLLGKGGVSSSSQIFEILICFCRVHVLLLSRSSLVVQKVHVQLSFSLQQG